MKSARDKLESILAYSLLFFLPTQLGRHFWPPYTFVSGIRVDLLSPTVYFTDVLILCLFIVVVFNRKRFQQSLNRKIPTFLLPVALFLFLNAVFALRPVLSWYGLGKLLEYVFFSSYIGAFFPRHKKMSVFIFSIAVMFESLLSITQFIHQGSVGGVLYFFGERTFSGTTPGIANASITGHLVLRPYATFSHPNVLAGFLVLNMTLLLGNWHILKTRKAKLALIFTFFVGTSALFLTLSRVAIFLMVVLYTALGIHVFSKVITRKKLFIITFVTIGLSILGTSIFFPLLYYRFSGISLNDESIVIRETLLKSAFLMAASRPLIGVGLYNFLPALPFFDVASRSIFTLQPVHNIFLLVASELGVSGFVLFTAFFVVIYRRLFRDYTHYAEWRYSFFLGVCLSEIILLGMFDHYFLTIQQGQLLFALIIGLSMHSRHALVSRMRIKG